MIAEFGSVLIDAPDGTDLRGLEAFGHPVVVCHGPALATLCPILGGEGCPKAEGAHGIVFALDLDRPQHRAILRTYQETLREDVPIAVSVTPAQSQQHTDLLAGLRVWTHAPSVGDLDALISEVEASDLG